MSSESLEDGEIPSESERSPEPATSGDLNDEVLIDQIVQNENAVAQRIQSPVRETAVREETPPSRRRPNRSERRRNTRRQESAFFSPPFDQNMGTSWQTNGSGSASSCNSGGRPIRPSPGESVIFGMSAAPPQNPNHDIQLLQNLVHHSYELYPPPGINRAPLHFFPGPPAPASGMPRPLMSIPFQHQMMMHPPPPPPKLQSISPTPLPQSFDDNYEQVCMEMVSPDEPQSTAPVKPPIEIPLEAVVPPKAPLEDEDALRAMLLSQINQKKKRNAEKPFEKSPPKRLRQNSPKLSESVENLFETQKPIPQKPPVAKIQVKITTTAKSKSKSPDPIPPGLNANPETPDSPESPSPTPIAKMAPEKLSREARKAQLELQMFQLNKAFEEQRAKVASASKIAKAATAMAREAEELAKKAEEMNRKAMEMRQQCIDDSKTGKEEMKRILKERREAQDAIDLMSIDDMEEIDVEEFDEIIITSVRRDSNIYRDAKQEPTLKAECSNAGQSNTTESSFEEPENPEELGKADTESGGSQARKETETEEKVEENEDEYVEEVKAETSVETCRQTENEDDEEIEGEDEYEEDDDEVFDTCVSPMEELAVAPISDKNVMENGENSLSKDVEKPPEKQKESVLEQVLRQRLMSKMSRVEKSPENSPPVVSSTSTPEHAEECRNMLLKMCKFELNGKCERPRDCTFHHLHDITDRKQQAQLLEGLFRDVFHYSETDIEPAIQQTLHFLPEFHQFEKLMDQFFKVVIHQTPDYKNKLFTFFANRR